MVDQKIYAIIDGSGSMSRVRYDVVKALNEFVAEQKDLIRQSGEVVLFSLTAFDSNVKRVYIEEDLTLVNTLTVQDTFLGGGTALYDAIGQTLSKAEDNAGKRNVVVIYTDGAENQSSEFTKDQIKALVEKLEATHKWQFVYLGAELADFNKEAAAAGIQRTNSVNTRKNKLTGTFKDVSKTVAYQRGATDAQYVTILDNGLVATASAALGVFEEYEEEK